MTDRPGIFTTLRAAGGEIWFWPDHLARLRDGAARLGLAMPGPELLEEEIAARIGGLADARVRVTLRPDTAPLVEAEAYAPPGAAWRLQPVPASPDEDTDVHRKTTERQAYESARRAAGDADDALLVHDGNCLECTVANLFFLTDGRLLTPPATAPLLPGIARARVLAAAREAGLETVESPIATESASAATECFVTNALFVVHSVARIEGFGRYDEGGWARQLREAVVQTAPKKRIIQ